MVFYVYADLCSLLAATSQFSILIGQDMQLTGCHNGNEMRNATCVDTQILIECPYCSFPVLCQNLARLSSLHDMKAVAEGECSTQPIVVAFHYLFT